MDQLSVMVVQDFKCQQQKSDLHAIRFVFDPAYSGLSGKQWVLIREFQYSVLRCCTDYKLGPVIKIT